MQTKANEKEAVSAVVDCIPAVNCENLSFKVCSMEKSTHRKRLLLYACGIFFCFFYFGILQEKITRTKYGESKEIFRCTISLVFIQCIVNAVFAKILLATVFDQPHDTTKKSYYIMCAFTYLTAMVSSNMALIHVNYPTQVVSKSCKPIPVMILGVLIGRKSYSLLKYMFVLTIVLGVGIFMYKDKAATSKTAASSDTSRMIGAGELLLMVSLLMDGLTGAIQERMKTEHQTKSGHMMFNMNLWSIIFLGIAWIATGEVWMFIDFINRFPVVIYYILGFSILSAFGQMFIFLTVTEFGPLPCSIITTTRKFFTVLASVIFFGNSLTSRQWLGALLVFTGLTLDGIYGKSAAKTK
ncbi:solute carrier family 35 member B1-like protein [Dinothrombium tinctorium]|uniref:Solute carrier family 35 member B1-like protein n=1 Tax=Dinothrombium tinctorium TaxID=1965070 RepID=A0A3S3NSQ2_9ACAR|nr:solute carrier family 35 member B1-like protein [Dinothrombium tinctorium]